MQKLYIKILNYFYSKNMWFYSFYTLEGHLYNLYNYLQVLCPDFFICRLFEVNIDLFTNTFIFIIFNIDKLFILYFNKFLCVVW